MKGIFFLLLIVFTGSFSQATETCEEDFSIVGKWKFVNFIYQGQLHPPLNPHLQLFYEFYETGTNRLWWHRTEETGFCERIGRYEVTEEETLKDVILWVNPKNNIDCSKDPDMQKGRKSETKFEFKQNKLYIHLSLNEEPFTYVWEKQDN